MEVTDNEIIKALECRIDNFSKSVLDLIKLKNAEIERLQKKANTPFAEFTFDENKLKEIVSDAIKNIEFNLNSVKSEAIKEFAERLKCGVPQETGVIRCADVDNLVKEMTEVQE